MDFDLIYWFIPKCLLNLNMWSLILCSFIKITALEGIILKLYIKRLILKAFLSPFKFSLFAKLKFLNISLKILMSYYFLRPSLQQICIKPRNLQLLETNWQTWSSSFIKDSLFLLDWFWSSLHFDVHFLTEVAWSSATLSGSLSLSSEAKIVAKSFIRFDNSSSSLLLTPK